MNVSDPTSIYIPDYNILVEVPTTENNTVGRLRPENDDYFVIPASFDVVPINIGVRANTLTSITVLIDSLESVIYQVVLTVGKIQTLPPQNVSDQYTV